MSDAVSYISEPATAGKLVLHTTIGDLDLELFSQQASETCRTFLSLALRHAYDGCTFHRIERDFLAQSGDLATSALPLARLQRLRTAEWFTNPLKPELHSRLRFNRRGLVGLARSAKPNTTTTTATATGAVEDNAQFFITLASTPELTNTHTLFGKITGDTLYNLSRLNDTDVATTAIAAVQVRITGVEVLSCPWEGLVGEVAEEEREWRVREEEEERRRKKREDGSNRLLKRNVNALSFEADELEEREEQADRRKKGKALYDILLKDDSKQATDDVREDAPNETGQQPSPTTSRLPTIAQTHDDDEEDEDKYDRQMRERVLRDKLASTDNTQPQSTSASPTHIKQHIQQLTKQLFPSTPATNNSTSTASDAPIVSMLEQRKQRFMQQKRQRPDDSTASTDVMAKLAHFRTKLQHAQPTSSTTTTSLTTAPSRAPDDGDENKVDWVTASASLLRDAEDEEERKIREQERAEGMAWMRHRLHFTRRPQDYDEEGGRDDGLVVFDPTGREGSTEEVRMGKKGLGVESNDSRKDGSGKRERRRDDHGNRYSDGGTQSHERRDRR